LKFTPFLPKAWIDFSFKRVNASLCNYEAVFGDDGETKLFLIGEVGFFSILDNVINAISPN